MSASTSPTLEERLAGMHAMNDAALDRVRELEANLAAERTIRVEVQLRLRRLRAALLPFAAACPPRERAEYTFEARDGIAGPPTFSVGGLRAGLSIVHFEDARRALGLEMPADVSPDGGYLVPPAIADAMQREWRRAHAGPHGGVTATWTGRRTWRAALARARARLAAWWSRRKNERSAS